MTPRRQRMLAVGLALGGIAIAAVLTLRALDDNMMFFIDVSDVVAGEYPADRNFRVGGLVVDGSVEREPGSLELRFRVTDLRCELPVRYTGVLPDLFREGQGVVAHGRMAGEGEFVADTILAKHDENYMAPEVAESLAEHVTEQTAGLRQGSGECNPQ
ncbi:MAG: cytochrome c maturation protein CcmE [Gammaproteobacteria bacterium]|nr:cytochrome c maturation protein CcmE [Gammaproteobacteria bacterium]MDH5304913.1 cytochrome c maturation protein CcmE [Gammaproteobacteria bacterium]MDH5322858.1 cytochrome c maturation protein CcmE [Gammaproteobacteria bacterium]